MDDIELVQSHAKKIVSHEVLDAYYYFVGIGVTSPEFSCKAVNKGEVCDFRYYVGKEQPFAFIINQKSLKFYFRKFSIEEYGMSVEGLKRHIQNETVELKKPPRREFSVDIYNLETARNVANYALLRNR